MRKAVWLGAVSAMSVALGAPAFAQAPATKSDEIVVTAQKRAQALADVPLPVQAFGAEQLENSGASKVSDLVALIPGASVVSSSTPGFETVQIRGISSGTTGDGLVGYYIDETPFGVPNLQLTPPAGLLDVARAEVIRGPSGTIYGQGSMGGTIKLVTKRPDSTGFSGSLVAEGSSTSGGSENTTFGGVLNVPLVQDKLAVRIAGQYDKLGGYAKYDDVAVAGIQGDDVNDFKGVNVRANVLWTPTPDLDVSAMYWRIDNQQGASNTLTLGITDPTITGSGRGPGFTDVNMDLYSLTVNWKTPIGTLTSNSSYVDHTLDFDVNFLTIAVNDSTFDTTSFTQEIRLTSDNDKALKWLVGGFYRDATIDSDICVYAFACPVFSFINVKGPLETKSWSLFGEASLDLLGGKLVPLVGLRYFEDDRSSNGVDRVSSVRSSVSAKWDKLSPRFNLSYKPTDGWLFFANAANGFRSGALQTPAQSVAANAALGLPAGTIGTQIKPDELWTYEVGSRWQSSDRAVTLEASVYRTDWKDVQTQFASAAVISVANAGDYRIEGFDVGLNWRTPIEGLQLQFVGNVNKSEITSAPTALSLATAIDVGARVPNVPKQNFTVAANYSRPTSLFGGAALKLYGAYAFRDTQLDATTGARSGKLNDLTLRAGFEKAAWSVEAFALNGLDDNDPAVVTPGSAAYQILYPRRVGVRMGVNF